MPRYVAFLRGVSPLNTRMPALKASFEAAGFSDVRTLLSSGNVVFDTPSSPAAAGFPDVRTLLSSGNVVFDPRSSSAVALERRAERAMQSELDRSFSTI